MHFLDRTAYLSFLTQDAYVYDGAVVFTQNLSKAIY